MNEFRGLLLDIAQHLRVGELDNLKFACSSFIPAGRAEFITRPHELFLELERMGKLSENNRDFLATTFIKIGRNDLRNKLLEIPEGPLYVPPPEQPHHRATSNQLEPFNQKVNEDLILEIAEKISTNWKFLGRHLKIPEHKLRSIDDTFKSTEERSYNMLIKWHETNRSPTVLNLLRALDKCGRRDLAELVESRVSGGVSPSNNEPRENTDAGRARPFPAMNDLQADLPRIGNDIRNPQQRVPPGTDVHAPQRRQQRQGTGDVIPDRPNNTQDEPGEEVAAMRPVQVSDNDDLKKPGGLFDSNTYTILDALGIGGFAKVYCVMEKSTNKKFAVKAVDLGENDEITQMKVAALEKEIKLLKVLDNPYVVKYYKTEVQSNLLCLFMEYMPGNSIAKKLNKVRYLEEGIVRKYTWQLLKGLEYLHDNKVIHRDIKGGNILLDQNEEHVKLSDFGISVSMEGIATSTGNNMSNTGLMASVYWTSPELLCSENYSYNTDIWSLGCTVMEMLTGNPPYRNSSIVLVQIMYKISTCSVVPPEECSSLAKIFLDQCFLKKSQRPSAKDLLANEFPDPQ